MTKFEEAREQGDTITSDRFEGISGVNIPGSTWGWRDKKKPG